MERKRRERINLCLNELASFLTEARLVKVPDGKAAKLEKADILEMTVKYLQSLKRSLRESSGDKENIQPTCSQNLNRLDMDISKLDKENVNPSESNYILGFKKCINAVSKALTRCADSSKENFRLDLINHLLDCLQSISVYKSRDKKEGVLLPLENNKENTASSFCDKFLNVLENESCIKVEIPGENNTRITLIPTKLETGKLAFLVQGGIDLSTFNGNQTTQSLKDNTLKPVKSNISKFDEQKPKEQCISLKLSDASCSSYYECDFDNEINDNIVNTLRESQSSKNEAFENVFFVSDTNQIKHSDTFNLPSVSGYTEKVNCIERKRAVEPECCFLSDDDDIEESDDELPYDLSTRKMWRPW